MAAQWCDIAEYGGVYQASYQEQVRNTKTRKIFQPVAMKNGRIYVAPAAASNENAQPTAWWLLLSRGLPQNHEITHKDGDCLHNFTNLDWHLSTDCLISASR